jgi:hypothetical protein
MGFRSGSLSKIHFKGSASQENEDERAGENQDKTAVLKSLVNQRQLNIF